MKKFVSLLLAIMMVFSLAITTFATDDVPVEPLGDRPTSGTIDKVRGSITINDITIKDDMPVATYKLYQMLKLNSFDFNSNSYIYEIADDWQDFFETGEGKDYITRNETGHIVWSGSSDASRVEAFAQKALEYAATHNIDPTKSTDEKTENGEAVYDYSVSGASSIIFEDLELGYYLVDSSVGALCGLSTTNPDGLINSKNGSPVINKQVQEDLTQQWDKNNSADIGQNVDFRTTITVHDGAQNYVLHDIMEKGLTFDATSVSVTVITSETGSAGNPVTTSNYTVNTNPGDGCTFHIEFENNYCAELNTNNRLVVAYSAILNRDADIGKSTTDNPANQNTTWLGYGDNHNTEESTTTTNTYAIDLVKTDGQNKLLPGAKFRIYDAETGGNEIKVVRQTDRTTGQEIDTKEGYPIYRRAGDAETGIEINVVDGLVRIIGLDNGTYWLEETAAPDGYNKIEARQSFTIADNNHDAIVTNNIVSTNSGVQVVNHTGTMLPETGAFGTTMFIIFGTFVMLATGVLLVTKKRMSMIQE